VVWSNALVLCTPPHPSAAQFVRVISHHHSFVPPPSTMIVCPVTKPLSGPAKNSITRETSSSVPDEQKHASPYALRFFPPVSYVASVLSLSWQMVVPREKMNGVLFCADRCDRVCLRRQAHPCRFLQQSSAQTVSADERGMQQHASQRKGHAAPCNAYAVSARGNGVQYVRGSSCADRRKRTHALTRAPHLCWPASGHCVSALARVHCR
jgi:hypothetical protein